MLHNVLALSPLRLPVFRRIAAAYTVNELGDSIGEVALAILVFDRTGSPLATAALFVALRFIPAVLAPLVTTRFEVVAPRVLLPLLYLGEAAVFAGIAVLAGSFSLLAVLALGAADGILSITAKALVRSAAATTLESEGLLREGNAIINLGMTAGSAIGPVFAGILIAADGVAPALALDAGTFVIAAAIIVTAQSLEIDSDRTASGLMRLRAGLREAWSRPVTRRLLLGASAGLLFGTLVIPIEVVFAKRTLHAGDIGYGALIAAWGAGMVIGGAAFAAAGRIRLMLVVSGGVGVIAAGYAGLAAAPDLAVACAFSAVGGIGNGVWVIAVITALQQSVPPTARSLVMALLGSINQVTPAVGYIAGGVVTAASSPRAAYGLAAAGVALVFASTLVSLVRGRGLAVPAQETQ